MKLHPNESQVVSESLFSILCQSLAFAHRLEASKLKNHASIFNFIFYCQYSLPGVFGKEKLIKV